MDDHCCVKKETAHTLWNSQLVIYIKKQRYSMHLQNLNDPELLSLPNIFRLNQSADTCCFDREATRAVNKQCTVSHIINLVCTAYSTLS